MKMLEASIFAIEKEFGKGSIMRLGAKQAVAVLREQGLEAYYTKGQKPRRMLHNAFQDKKAAIIRRAEQVLKGRMD